MELTSRIEHPAPKHKFDELDSAIASHPEHRVEMSLMVPHIEESRSSIDAVMHAPQAQRFDLYSFHFIMAPMTWISHA